MRLATFSLCLAASACISPAQRVQSKEDVLAAAGFTLVPANTPQRQDSLASLPPHKFVRQVRGDKVTYSYADPTICGCVYIGDQAAYGRYRETESQKHLADEQTTAEMQEMTTEMMHLNWGLWNPDWYD
jgi:hypothetical protein